MSSLRLEDSVSCNYRHRPKKQRALSLCNTMEEPPTSQVCQMSAGNRKLVVSLESSPRRCLQPKQTCRPIGILSVELATQILVGISVVLSLNSDRYSDVIWLMVLMIKLKIFEMMIELCKNTTNITYEWQCSQLEQLGFIPSLTSW